MKPSNCLTLASVTIATLGALSSQASTFVLSGDYLQVGVGSGGTLIDDGFITGIKFDPSGQGHFTSAQEVLSVGYPWEYFAFNIGGEALGVAASVMGSPYGFRTFNASTHSTLISNTYGSMGVLDYSSLIYFDRSSTTINFTISISNSSLDTTINDLYFARGFDPDQDYLDGAGSSDTYNYLWPNPQHATAAAAYGPLSGVTISLRDLTGLGRLGVSSVWGGTEDPVGLYTAPPQDLGTGDNTLNIAYHIPELGPGQQVEMSFQYALVPEPEKSSVALGLASLVGGILLRRQRNAKPA